MPASNREIQVLAESVGVELPASYFEFLDSLPTRPKLFDTDDTPRFQHQNCEWFARSREGLFEPVRTDRDSSKPAAYSTAFHAELLTEWTVKHGEEFAVALTERGWTMERLARGFSFGADDNGDPIFLEPQTGGVFIYHHDGMDVEQLADSLDEFLSQSTECVMTQEERAALEAMEIELDQPTADRPACPHCGKPLATAKAKQCFKCGADWH